MLRCIDGRAEAHRDAIEHHVLSPVRMRLNAERAETDRRAAADACVDFFTMVRGED